ncbi:ArsR/SmtB family transcription factor [Actinoplanes sp. NPDC000266]
MSLGDEPGRASLRATAHPVRLQIMSLLTGAPMTAAEVARELGLTHANASYHLRNLLAGGLIVQAGEEKIRGGVAKRYRYDASRDKGRESPEQLRAMFSALGGELIRRTGQGQWDSERRRPGATLLADGDFWIDPDKWAELRHRMHELVREIHEAAQPPRTPGTMRTSTTVAMFEMES